MNPRIPHHKVAHISIISESEVFITVLCLPCSPRYTALRLKKCSKSMPVIKVVTMRKYDGTVHPSYYLKLKYPLPFSVSSLYSRKNQELFEKHLCNQSSHY